MDVNLQENTEYFEANADYEEPSSKITSTGLNFELDEKVSSEKCSKHEINIKALCDLWHKAGVCDSLEILQLLEVDKLNEGIITFFELFDALEREVKLSVASNNEKSILNALLVSYKYHIHSVNSEMELYCQDLIETENKIKMSSNQNSKLLEELDNVYANMDRKIENDLSNVEKQWSSKILTMKREFIEEREMMLQQFEYDKDALKCEIDSLQLSQVHSQRKCNVLEKENQSLSQESFQLYKSIEELDNESQILRNDMEIILMAKEEEEIKNVSPTQEERLLVMVKDLRTQLKHFSDKNDVLSSENSSLKHQITLQTKKELNESLSQELSTKNYDHEKQLKNELDILDVKENKINSNVSNNESREVRYLEVKQSRESHNTPEPEMLTELCRKFASEKGEIIAKHETEQFSLKEELEMLKKQLAAKNNEIKCLGDLLDIEKIQYSESLESLQETIQKLKTSSFKSETEISLNIEKELTKKHDHQILMLKKEHAKDLNAIKAEIQKKLDTLLAEKQKCLNINSVNCNIDTLQKQIQEEHKIMNDRLIEIRANFESEALDIHGFLNSQKDKLKHELQTELNIFEQRFAEETDIELKLQNSILSEKEKYLDLLSKTNEQENKLQLLTVLHHEENRKTNQLIVENEVNDTVTGKNNISIQKYCKENEQFLEMENEKIEQQFLKKEIQNVSLTEKVNELKEIIQINKHEIASLQTVTKVKLAENKQLALENQILNQKIHDLNHSQLEYNEIPENNTSILKHHFQMAMDQKNLEINELEKEIYSLSKKLKGYDNSAIISAESEVKTSPSLEKTSSLSDVNEQGPLRQRLSIVTSRLSEQMKKSKAIYTKLSKTELLVKDMYCENTQLMRALQLTEMRQKDAEKLCQEEKDRCDSLTQILQSVFSQLTQ